MLFKILRLMLLNEVYHLGNTIHYLSKILLIEVDLVAREVCCTVSIYPLARLGNS